MYLAEVVFPFFTFYDAAVLSISALENILCFPSYSTLQWFDKGVAKMVLNESAKAVDMICGAMV